MRKEASEIPVRRRRTRVVPMMETVRRMVFPVSTTASEAIDRNRSEREQLSGSGRGGREYRK